MFMKILVLSDSHSSLRLMRSAVEHIKPNAIVHLGDYFDDGQAIHEEHPHIPFHQVPGNCDRNRMYQWAPEVLSYCVCGVKLYMTHGHQHRVKETMFSLLQDAKAEKAQCVLYGHTHIPDCHQEGDMWVLNPGSCGHGGATVGLIEVSNSKILSCRILKQEDWEEMQ